MTESISNIKSLRPDIRKPVPGQMILLPVVIYKNFKICRQILLIKPGGVQLHSPFKLLQCTPGLWHYLRPVLWLLLCLPFPACFFPAIFLIFTAKPPLLLFFKVLSRHCIPICRINCHGTGQFILIPGQF